MQTLNRHFFSWHANEAGSRFNLAASKSGVMPGITFSKLPMAFQTAMVDVYLADPKFLESDAFSRFACGQWSAGLLGLSAYAGTHSAAAVRARTAAVSLSKIIARMPSPVYRRATS